MYRGQMQSIGEVLEMDSVKERISYLIVELVYDSLFQQNIISLRQSVRCIEEFSKLAGTNPVAPDHAGPHMTHVAASKERISQLIHKLVDVDFVQQEISSLRRIECCMEEFSDIVGMEDFSIYLKRARAAAAADHLASMQSAEPEETGGGDTDTTNPDAMVADTLNNPRRRWKEIKSFLARGLLAISDRLSHSRDKWTHLKARFATAVPESVHKQQSRRAPRKDNNGKDQNQWLSRKTLSRRSNEFQQNVIPM